MYFSGKGVLQDYVEAYAWANVAASINPSYASALRGEILSKMSPEQITKGQIRAKELSQSLD